ncbi:sugar-specific transcriptional regulator, TrmB family [Propionibacterium acidifaciens F0233]|uniref:Sugar-specific transcriptional regulator, TrmB family n=1 Tax=Propionibacterium acidifaciens F0233 TaxID=553198 RepID=U2S6Z4_9ACTN|nr:sugar-specific transcriptional regulator, TrmB family [Propionibacterium acidifaciens F0233]
MRMIVSPEPPHDDEAEYAAEVLKLLADRTRLSILAMLSQGEMSVTEIARALDRPMPAVSQHLAKLRTAGLIGVRKNGTTNHYQSPSEHVIALVTNALQLSEHALYETPPHHRAAR